MSTLDNLRYYADGVTVRDRQEKSRVLKFGVAGDELLSKTTAKLLNELPEWHDRFMWDTLPAWEGNAS